MALGFAADHEVRLVDELLANADVSLEDEGTGVVHALGIVHLVDTGLETSLQKLLSRQTQDVIESLLILRQDAVACQPPQDSITLKNTLGVLLIQSEQLTGCRSHLGEAQLSTPDLSLGAQTILAEQLHLLIQTLLLVGASGGARRLAVVAMQGVLWPAGTMHVKQRERNGHEYNMTACTTACATPPACMIVAQSPQCTRGWGHTIVGMHQSSAVAPAAAGWRVAQENSHFGLY